MSTGRVGSAIRITALKPVTSGQSVFPGTIYSNLAYGAK